jgi:hypothetical protein
MQYTASRLILIPCAVRYYKLLCRLKVTIFSGNGLMYLASLGCLPRLSGVVHYANGSYGVYSDLRKIK